MDHSDVVEVYSAANLQEAHFLKNLLENEGIEAQVVGDYLEAAAGALPSGWTTASRVWVPKADAKRALDVIRQWEAGHHDGPTETPSEP